MKTPLRLSPYLAAAAALAIAAGRAAEFALALLSIFAHECAHAAAAKLIGFTVEELRLSPLGASLRLRPDVSRDPLCEILIAAAGPIFSLLTALLCATLSRHFPTAVLRDLCRINLVFGVFNLLPAYPTDGGRIVHAALTWMMSEKSASRVCRALGVLTGAGIMALAICGMGRHGINATLLCAGTAMAALSLRKREGENRVFASYEKSAAIRSGRPVRMQWLAVGEGTSIDSIARLLKNNAFFAAVIYDRSMRPVGVVDESRLAAAAARLGGEKSVKTLLNDGESGLFIDSGGGIRYDEP